MSAEGVPVDSGVSLEADEGVLPDNTPSYADLRFLYIDTHFSPLLRTPERPRPSGNILTGYPTPESIPRPTPAMRYAVAPALTSTVTQNDDDTMIVDEPQCPANDELDGDERTDELVLKVRFHFSCRSGAH